MIRRSWMHIVAALAAAAIASPASAQEAWKIGTVVAPPSMLGVIVDEGAAAVGKATGGRITAERFQNPNEQELTQNILRGRLEMGYISATGMAVAVPEMGVLNMPYLWRSEAERDYVLDKIIPPLLEQIMASKGLTLVKVGEAGWTNLFCKTPCTTPDKMKGMKMRVSPTAGAKLFADRLGVNGAGMSLADFYPALQQGVVDAGDLTSTSSGRPRRRRRTTSSRATTTSRPSSSPTSRPGTSSAPSSARPSLQRCPARPTAAAAWPPTRSRRRPGTGPRAASSMNSPTSSVLPGPR